MNQFTSTNTDSYPFYQYLLSKYGTVDSPKIISAESKNKCPICSKTFFKPFNLSRHLKNKCCQKPNKNFKCSFCGKNFARSFCLKRHQKICKAKTDQK